MRFKTFVQAMSYMESFNSINTEKSIHDATRYHRLQRMKSLLDKLGNPQQAFKTIHVAGSKGKGSTACFLANGLQAAGFKTGLYASPHICDYRERFTLCGTFFEDDFLITVAQQMADIIDTITFDQQWGEGIPTTFELFTCYAYLLFSKSGCQWAVIETGLGGRLDATNTIKPQASVLCPIELEHTSVLGNTLGQIATEKAKIIKEHVPCFISYQQAEAMEVFIAEAKQQGSPIKRLSQELQHIESVTQATGEHVHLSWKDGTQDTLSLSMYGHVQAQNCALALMVLRTLGVYDPKRTPQALEQATLPGRFQILPGKPPVIIDGAHTLQSLTQLCKTVETLYFRGNTAIFGLLSDKDQLPMLRLILEHFDTVIICRPGTYKPSDIDLLYEQACELANGYTGKTVLLRPKAEQALLAAKEHTPDTHVIVTCGSFYLAGDMKKAYDAVSKEQQCH